MGIMEVLNALEEELHISFQNEMQVPLKRSEFEFVMITKLGYCDERTHVKYWNSMRKARLTVGTNQHTAILDVAQFCKMIGVENPFIRKRLQEEGEVEA